MGYGRGGGTKRGSPGYEEEPGDENTGWELGQRIKREGWLGGGGARL